MFVVPRHCSNLNLKLAAAVPILDPPRPRRYHRARNHRKWRAEQILSLLKGAKQRQIDPHQRKLSLVCDSWGIHSWSSGSRAARMLVNKFVTFSNTAKKSGSWSGDRNTPILCQPAATRSRGDPDGTSAGKIVIADRFFDSTTVYKALVERSPPKRSPSSTALPSATACGPHTRHRSGPSSRLERARGRELFDRMENLSLEFYQRVRQGYL